MTALWAHYEKVNSTKLKRLRSSAAWKGKEVDGQEKTPMQASKAQRKEASAWVSCKMGPMITTSSADSAEKRSCPTQGPSVSSG